jgi:hypothetical protein
MNSINTERYENNIREKIELEKQFKETKVHFERSKISIKYTKLYSVFLADRYELSAVLDIDEPGFLEEILKYKG